MIHIRLDAIENIFLLSFCNRFKKERWRIFPFLEARLLIRFLHALKSFQSSMARLTLVRDCKMKQDDNSYGELNCGYSSIKFGDV